jgi:hypothetical protein
MTKRILFHVEESLQFDTLPPQVLSTILALFGQYVVMPGAVPSGGRKLVDCVCSDAFTPSALASLGLDWVIVGMWDDKGVPLIPLNEPLYLTFRPDGEECHKWAGWPSCF